LPTDKREIASPLTEARSDDDWKWNVVYSTGSASHNHVESDEKMAENDSKPSFPPRLILRLSIHVLTRRRKLTKPFLTAVPTVVRDVMLLPSANQKRKSTFLY
jgi:hypothetical protein